MPEVTDPALLAQLNGTAEQTPAQQPVAQPQAQAGAPKEVTDPKLLAQLNGAPGEKGPSNRSTGYGQTSFKGALGGATGALVMPWALIGGGAVMEATGVGAPVGVAMQVVGGDMLALQTASTGAMLATVAGGAALGAISAPAGQAAEETALDRGMSPKTAGAIGAGTELATGVAAGSAWGIVKSAAMDMLPAAAKGFMKFYHAATKATEEAGTSVSAAVAKARAMLQDPSVKEQPQHVLHSALQSAAEAHSIAADKVATGIENEGRMKAQQIMQAGQQKAFAAQNAGMAEQARLKAEAETAAGGTRAKGEQAAVTARAQHATDIARLQRQAHDEATAVLEKAHLEAAKLRADAQAKQTALEKASQGKSKWAAGILKMMQPKLAEVGEARVPSAIGKELEDKIAGQKQVVDEALAESDSKLRATRNEAVDAQEKKGILIGDTKGIKDLRDEMHSVLLTSEKGREMSRVMTESGEKIGKARVTESGVKRAFENMQEALKTKRIAVEWNESGTPTKFEQFGTSFEAVDALRRKLQKAAFGKEAEGYEALGQKLAKSWYDKLSLAQEKYLGEPGAGNPQHELQKNYKAGLDEGEKFKSRMGRMALEQDKTSTMAQNFFRDQNGVRDLKALVGNEETVNRAGADYLAGKLQGHNAAYVKNFLQDVKNRDWLEELPTVNAKAQAYLKELESGEALLARRADVAAKLTTRAAEQQKVAGAVGTAAEKAGRRVVGEATGQANALTTAAEKATKPMKAAGEVAAKTAKQEAEAAAKQIETKAKADAIEAKAKADAAARTATSTAKAEAGAVQEEKFALAKKVRAIAKNRVDAVVKGGTRPEDVESLINKGSVDEVAAAGKMLAGIPKGQQAWVDGVTRIVVKKTPAQLGNWWEVRGRDIARIGGASPEQLQKLDAGVQRILEAAEPKLKAQLKKKLETSIIEAMGAAMGAGVAARTLPDTSDN